MDLMSFVKRHDNVIDEEYCNYLKEKFDNSSNCYEDIKQSTADFTQIHLYEHDEWKEDSEKLQKILLSRVADYKMQAGVTKEMWPNKYGLEGLRMKRYLPNDKDEFRPHVDVNNYENARRFLVFFLYLDDNVGGMTTFPLMNKGSPCKKGSLLIFPPMWPWLHAGQKPIDTPKYIVGSYLHYV